MRTCHRVELYGTADGVSLPDLAELPPGVERLTDVDAVRHLVSVACGLDSAVFGETQILHQLRETLEERHGEQPLDPVLERLFQTALRAGREARTHFTGSPRSLADTALDRIGAIGAPPSGGAGAGSRLPILVVGVGRMARLAAFAATRRGARVIVTNRTASRAADLAHEVGGAVLPFGVDASLVPVSGTVVAISGPWPLGPRDRATLLGSGSVVVDLSSPPALPPEVAEQLGDRHVSVDDLAVAAGDGPDERIRRRVERIVSRAGGEFCQWLRARESVPAIRAVVGAAEVRRADEMAWLRRRLPDLSPEDLAVVEQMSHRLVASLIHAPLTALSNDEAGDLEPAVRELFGL
jgi:glutamyl-tRNA reductase